VATVAQILANRANARRSTGLRTPQGKARSSQNNRRYGFRSVQPESLSPTDYPEFAQLLHDLRLDVRPQNPAEDRCCLDLASAVFQLRLLAQAEVEALTRHPDDPATLIRKSWTFARYRSRPQRLYFQSLRSLRLLRTRPTENDTSEPNFGPPPAK
jgi:hypothetical protein